MQLRDCSGAVARRLQLPQQLEPGHAAGPGDSTPRAGTGADVNTGACCELRQATLEIEVLRVKRRAEEDVVLEA